MNLDWLDDGSLLILLPEALLGDWHGVDSDDYDRACAVASAWLNLIPVQEGPGLLLGGDVGMVLCTHAQNGSIVIIRWVYAEDEHDLVEFALSGNSITKSEPDLVFNNSFPDWRLFNAAANPSADQPPMRAIELPLGQVRVETVFCESKINAAIVHEFYKSA